ncbi:hypothetical protein F3K36_16395 [Delftia sp. BR1]|nr:hypothetical protein F3K36_16395 [Delftia sp. BR1]
MSMPTEISPDGREIWDWAGRLSDRVHRTHEARQLRERISAMESECGSCSRWMTNSCPKEVHDNRKGRKVGPSSRAMKCQQFEMSSLTAGELEKAKAKLAQVEALLNGGAS